MNPKRPEPSGDLRRTTLDPNKDTVRLGVYRPPIKCEGCGGRVDTFYRYNRPDDARCADCGAEWTLADPNA